MAHLQPPVTKDLWLQLLEDCHPITSCTSFHLGQCLLFSSSFTYSLCPLGLLASKTPAINYCVASTKFFIYIEFVSFSLISDISWKIDKDVYIYIFAAKSPCLNHLYSFLLIPTSSAVRPPGCTTVPTNIFPNSGNSPIFWLCSSCFLAS